MNKTKQPTKRQLRNLKIVRWPEGYLEVMNTKTLRFHCFAREGDKEQEDDMIRIVASGHGVPLSKQRITAQWNDPRNTQIRL